jgi:hypothetical protein
MHDPYEFKLPEHLGESARQFEWLKDETQALAAVTRGFGNIVDNARALDPEAPTPKRKEPQRLSYTRKGKKRKTKKR